MRQTAPEYAPNPDKLNPGKLLARKAFGVVLGQVLGVAYQELGMEGLTFYVTVTIFG